MKNDILLIYPQDESTDFLQGIPDFLFERHGERRFIHHKVSIAETDALKCLTQIEQASSTAFVIFLGHGSSKGLMGARSEGRDPELLIAGSNSHILKSKDVFLLSCRSSDFLKSQKLNGIGFGDLTTEWGEVHSRRESESDAYRHSKGDIREADIANANSLLVNIVCHSLHDAIIHQLSLRDLHLRLKLRFNQTLFRLIKENKPSQVRWTANLLLEAKTEMNLFL